MMVTLLVLMLQPNDVIIMCLLNDIRAIDFWPNEEVVSVKGCELGKVTHQVRVSLGGD